MLNRFFLLVAAVAGFAAGFAELDRGPGVPKFTDVTGAAGIAFHHINGRADEKTYIFEAKGGGVAFVDFDNDGWQDILLVQGSTLEKIRGGESSRSALYRNRRDGTFEDVTEQAGLRHGWGMGISVGDYDNDGFADLYFNCLGPNVLYKNNGNGTFTNVTDRAGVAGDAWSTSAAFGDYDRDGDLDLYVCNYLEMNWSNLPLPGSNTYCFYLGRAAMCGPLGIEGARDVLYRNNGDGTFSDVSEKTGVADRSRYYGLGVVWSDIDNDQDLDIYVANDATPNLLFINRGNGTFEEKALLAGLALSGDGREQASMGIDVADYDNDGLLDVFSTHFASDYSTLYQNKGNLVFEDVTLQSQIQKSEWFLVGWGTRFADFNHDGWKDIYHSNGHVYPFLRNSGLEETYYQPGSLYLNKKDGTFEDVSARAGDISTKSAKKSSRGVAFADFDNDGDIDFIVANMNDSPQLFRNDRTDRHHWIMFKTVGRKSNHDGLGTRITAVAGHLKQIWEIKRTVGIYSSSDPRAHFGLGSASKVDVLTVQWPSGKVQEFRDIAADQHYLIDEGSGLQKEL